MAEDLAGSTMIDKLSDKLKTHMDVMDNLSSIISKDVVNALNYTINKTMGDELVMKLRPQFDNLADLSKTQFASFRRNQEQKGPRGELVGSVPEDNEITDLRQQREGRLMSTASSLEDTDSTRARELFTTVMKRGKTKMTSSNVQSERDMRSIPSLVPGTLGVNNAATSNRTQQKKRMSMMGDSTSSILKASKNLNIKKAVYKISNIDSSYSVKDVTSHLESIKVRVVSCFELPRGPRQPEDNKNFRVCIYAVDKSKLLVRNNWSTGIVIQDWVFHQKKIVTDNPTLSSSETSLAVSSADTGTVVK